MTIPAVTQEYTPGACRNWRKLSRLLPLPKMRPDSPALHAENSVFPIKYIRNLDFLDGTSENPQEHCHKTRRTLLSAQECKIDWCTPNQLKMIWVDWSQFPCIGSIAISYSTSYTPSGLTSFRKIQRFPETPISSLEEYQFKWRNWSKSTFNPYHLEMIADTLSLTEKISQLSKRTSRWVFPQEYVCERNPVFSALSEVDQDMPWLERRPVFRVEA